MELWQLKQRQGLDLRVKIELSKKKIREFYEYFEGQVYVSFSGGKDSTVLLHLVRSIYPKVPAVFADTGLEYPEIKDFVKTIPNVIWVKPKMTFKEVIEKYGYPVISKDNSKKIYEYRTGKSQINKNRIMFGDKKGNGKLPKKWRFLLEADFKISYKCCDVIKKNPIKKYEKQSGNKGFVGNLVNESKLRKVTYLKRGCNAFNSKRPISTPIAFWKEENIWGYIKENNLSYSKIYDMGVDRTGCMFCMFGVHLEKGLNRFQRMKITHPKLWQYCIETLGCGKVLNYIGVNYECLV